jgi:hypothetical protein
MDKLCPTICFFPIILTYPARVDSTPSIFFSCSGAEGEEDDEDEDEEEEERRGR